MSFLGGIVDKVLAPIGVKPFGGGNYPDNGMGDRAQAQQALANQNANTQSTAGQGIYNTYLGPTTSAFDSGPMGTLGKPTGPNQLQQAIAGAPARTGDMANYSDALRNFATYNGIAQPGESATNAGQLLPWQETQLNKELGQISQARQNAIATETAALAKQGIVSGPAYQNAMARINAQYDQMNQAHASDFNSTAAQHQAQAQQVLAGLQQAGGQFDLQNQQAKVGNILNAVGQGNNMLNNASGIYTQGAALDNNIGQQARQQNAQTNSFWQGILGAGLSGDFGSFGSKGNVTQAGGNVVGGINPGANLGSSGQGFNDPQTSSFNDGYGPSLFNGQGSGNITLGNGYYTPITLGNTRAVPFSGGTGFGTGNAGGTGYKNPFSTGFGQQNNGVWG